MTPDPRAAGPAARPVPPLAALREEWDAVRTIVGRDLRRYFRERSQLLSAFARPVLWLFVLGHGLSPSFRAPDGVGYLPFIFPGIMTLTLIFTSVLSAISIIWDKEFGFLRAVLVAPVSRSSIAIGKGLAGALLGAIQAGVILVLAPLAGLRLAPAGVALAVPVLLLGGLALTGLGVAIAARMSSFEGFGTIVNFLIMPLYFLSGALFPPAGLPGWLRAAVLANPLTYCVDALRHALLGVAYFPLGLDLAVLAGAAAAFLALGIRAINRME
jgi:ABC-2 type transport system permease protein